MPKPESQFPTIIDLRDALTRLVDEGLGALPVQVLVVPDSTIQAIARNCGSDGAKPALMIELNYEEDSSRIPVSVVSTARMLGGGTASAITQ